MDLPAENKERHESFLETEGLRKRFFANIGSNATYILAQTIATMWLTPFLIGRLGIAAFGMIPLVNSLVSYMAILTTALNSAVSRFLAVDLGRNDVNAANRTFNTALLGLMGIIVLLTPVVLTVSFAFPGLFHVPPGWERDASWLFAAVGFAFFATVVGSNFAISPFVHSRFLLSNITNLAGLIARVGFIVILFSVFQARLWYAGGGILLGAIVCLLGYVVLWRKLTPELSIQLKAFDRSKLQSLMGMGGWVTVNMVGAMLLGRVDLIVVNAFFGAAMTGGYGSVAQFSLLMEYLVNAAAIVVRPVILIKYAKSDIDGLQRLVSQAVKLLGLLLALPVGLLCGFSRPLLSIWLGPSFEYLSILLILIVCHQSLNLSVRPMLDVQNAYNRVRWPGIVTLLSGCLALGLAVLSAMWGKWGAAGVAASVAVAWTAKNVAYMPLYTARIMGLPWWVFLPSLFGSILGTFFVGMASYGFTLLWMPAGWLSLAGSATVVSLLYLAVVWTVGLRPTDKQLVKDLSPIQTVGGMRLFPAK